MRTPLLLLPLVAADVVNFRAGQAASLSEQTSASKLPDTLVLLQQSAKGGLRQGQGVKFFCFPAGSVVRLGDGSTKKVEDLGAGDALETSANLEDLSHDDPFLFEWHSDLGAAQSTAVIPFLEVTHEAGSLRLTGNHLIFARKPEDDKAAVLMAEQLAVGDEILRRDGSQLRPSKVTSIKEVQAAGIYGPVTSSGRLVVNDVLVSSYAMSGDFPSFEKLFRVLRRPYQRELLETATHRQLAPLRQRYEQADKEGLQTLRMHRSVLTAEDKKGLAAADGMVSGFLALAGVDVSEEE